MYRKSEDLSLEDLLDLLLDGHVLVAHTGVVGDMADRLGRHGYPVVAVDVSNSAPRPERDELRLTIEDLKTGKKYGTLGPRSTPARYWAEVVENTVERQIQGLTPEAVRLPSEI